MTYTLYHELHPEEGYAYKLIQLPPLLLETLAKGEDTLVIKKTTPLTLCTDSSTYLLRRMNHSNWTELLTEVTDPDAVAAINGVDGVTGVNSENAPNGGDGGEMDVDSVGAVGAVGAVDAVDAIMEGGAESDDFDNKTLIGFAHPSYELEVTLFAGEISLHESIPLSELIDSSPISKNQFFEKFYNQGGYVDNNGNVAILSDDTIFSLLSVIIRVNLVKKSDVLLDLYTNVLAQDDDYNPSMILSLINRFGSISDQSILLEDSLISSSITYTLNNPKISSWFGVHALSQNPLKVWKIPEFLIFWKSTIPEFYDASLDIVDLSGNFCKPTDSTIKFINTKTLSSDIQTRFHQLFQFSPTWNYSEFLPFIDNLGKKPDTLILKFARKKKIKNKFFVVAK